MHVLIELDPETHRRLERVAPAKSRRRSAFIRAAIQKSLWELEEEQTRQAYVETPDVEAIVVDPAAWEPLPYGGFDPPAVEQPAKPKSRPRQARERARSRKVRE